MNAFWGHLLRGIVGTLAIGVIGPVTALAEDAGPAPRYTYLGAGYEQGDSRCAVEPEDEGLNGYTAEASVGIFDFLHLIGAYYDGETDESNLDGECYEIGLGVSYSLAAGTDIVLRGYWVEAESDDVSLDADGFEPELLVRHMISDRAEVNVGVAYYDMEDDANNDFDNTEVRLALVYNVLPWLAVRAGGSVIDDDKSFSAGVRAYFGDKLF
jgi:hypothetical protein